MCNRFIEDFSKNVALYTSKCDCFKLKNSCKYDEYDFQFTNRNIRKIFLKGEDCVFHGYQYTKIFELTFSVEMVDFAICYLHEKNIKNMHKLLSYMGEFRNFTNVESNIKMLMREKLKKHLICINTNIFNDYFVHVGFGEYNERDTLYNKNENRLSKIKLDGRNSNHQRYIFVGLNFWIWCFIREDNPRSFIENTEISHKELLNGNFLDFKYEKIEKVKKSLLQGKNINEKIISNIIENVSCECIKYKNFEYTSKNIRDMFKNFKLNNIEDSSNMLYKCQIPYNKKKSFKKISEFYDMALCYLQEKNYIDFFNIISMIGVNKKIIDEILKISYKDIKDYRVNVNLEYHHLKIYTKNEYTDNKKKKSINLWMSDEKFTDFERFNIPFGYFLNISFHRWLSDIITYENPMNKWEQLLKNGLKYKWKFFL